MTVQRTTKIWSDTITPGVCRSRRCCRRIYFAEVVKSGRMMPFDQKPVALAVQPEIGTNREQWTVDLAGSHFATCVAAPVFRGGGRA